MLCSFLLHCTTLCKKYTGCLSNCNNKLTETNKLQHSIIVAAKKGWLDRNKYNMMLWLLKKGNTSEKEEHADTTQEEYIVATEF